MGDLRDDLRRVLDWLRPAAAERQVIDRRG
jgi:hypothetical protein